ncbi:hypothetical protein GCM10027020_20840 [Nocardioides salsibiostraticola]
MSGEIQLGQIGDDPRRVGMVGARCLDQQGIDVGSDHVVTKAGQVTAVSPGSAARVEEAGAARGQGVDETSLALEVLSVCGHLTEALDVVT